MNNSAAAHTSRPSALDRLLRLFTDIRGGESATALLLTATVFLFLTSYYIIKVLREPLILTGGGTELSGAQIKSYSNTGQALFLLILVPLYGALAGRVPRRRLINIVTAFFVACLLVFYVLAQADVKVGVPFFVWVGIFNVMIIAQFWSFANDVYTEDEGKRLFPIVGFGASAGAIAGSWIAGRLIDPLGLNGLFVVAAIVLIGATIMTNLVDVRERRRTEATVPDVKTSQALPAATGQFRAVTGEFKAVMESEAYQQESGTFPTLKRGQTAEDVDREMVKSTGSAFALVFRNRYLLLIAFLIFVLNWVNTNGEFILGATVEQTANDAVARGDAADAGAYIGSFYSTFFSVVNTVTLLVQLFLVSRVIKFFGVSGALLVLPVIALGSYALIMIVPILGAMRWAKTAENSTDYSLQNTLKGVMFLPTTREEKYKAKQVTDSFFHRAGDVMHALTIFLATGVLALGVRHLAMLNILLVIVWLVIAVAIGRRYGRLAAATET